MTTGALVIPRPTKGLDIVLPVLSAETAPPPEPGGAKAPQPPRRMCRVRAGVMGGGVCTRTSAHFHRG